MKFRLKFIASSLAALLLISGSSTLAAEQTASENSAAAVLNERPLVQENFQTSDSHAPSYVHDVHSTQMLHPIGRQSISTVERVEVKNASSEAGPVPVARPPLRALISIDRSYNPLTLDAESSEKISLDEALRAALGENLDIARSYTQLESRKYMYLSAMAGFLPDITGGYHLVGLSGSLPAGLFGSVPMQLPSTIQILSTGFTYHVYQGGKVLFGTLEQKHRLRAAHAALTGSKNDVLLQVSRQYNDLVLNEALLEVRARAVEISSEQVRLNSQQEGAGTATGLDVLQAQAQLASDQQNLIEQQRQRRISSISLTKVLNASFALDLESSERELKMRRLIPQEADLNGLIRLAIDNRPDLKQYEELRLAAKRAIAVQASPLQPQVNLGGNIYGDITGSANINSIKLLDLSAVWTLGGLGMRDLANIQATRWQAREAAIQAKQAFQNVFQQVRNTYDQSLCAEAKVNRAEAQIVAAREELRISEKRKEYGVGLNIDVLNAQRDLTQARVNKVQALVDFNNSQSQLLHDIGLISVDSLSEGLKLEKYQLASKGEHIR